MESQPQNPEFRINPENFHPYSKGKVDSPGSRLIISTIPLILLVLE